MVSASIVGNTVTVWINGTEVHKATDRLNRPLVLLWGEPLGEVVLVSEIRAAVSQSVGLLYIALHPSRETRKQVCGESLMKRSLSSIVSCLIATLLWSQSGISGEYGLSGKSGQGGGPTTSVVKDNECSSGAFKVTGTHTCTMTLAPGVKNVIIAAYAISVGRTVTSVRVGSSKATQVGAVLMMGSGEMEMWKCASPPTGTQTITVNWDAGVTNTTMIAVSFTGGSGSFGTGVTNTGSITPASVTVSSATTHLVVDVKYRDQGTCMADTPEGNQTQFSNNICLNSNGSATGSTQQGAASVTTAWTLGANSNWGEIGVDVF